MLSIIINIKKKPSKSPAIKQKLETCPVGGLKENLTIVKKTCTYKKEN